MKGKSTYYERLSSGRTEALFVTLMLLFLGLRVWRGRVAGRSRLTTAFFGLSAFFLFYSLNYRTLNIHLTPEHLELRFGLFAWRIAMENIERCFRDETSLWRIGGAGIHFSWFGGRYRAMFNFLEYPRVVVALKEKQGPVQDVAFSTKQPEQVLGLIRVAASTAYPA